MDGKCNATCYRILPGAWRRKPGPSPRVLEAAGLITANNGYHGRRPGTRATITAKGRHAIRRELASMQALMQRLDSIMSTRRVSQGTQPSRPDATDDGQLDLNLTGVG
jgi:hypothetical protein